MTLDVKRREIIDYLIIIKNADTESYPSEKKMKLNSKQELIPHGLNLKQVKKYSWQENLVYEYNPEAREIHHNKRSFDTTKLQLFER